MALFDEDDGDAEDKTEEPSQKRLDRAIEQGNLPHSPELSAAVQALAGAGGLALLGGATWVALKESLAGALSRPLMNAGGHAGTLAGARSLALEGAITTGRCVLPILCFIGAAGIASTLMQRRPYFNFERISPDPSRLDPISNLGKAFSGKGLSGLPVTIVKVGLVLVVLRAVLLATLPQLAGLGSGTGLAASLATTGGFAVNLVVKSAFALVAAGALDFGLAYRAWRKGLRMSKEELKREAKEDDANPALKGKMRANARRRRSKKRMLEDVKTADAIITNPTHFAIAIKYDRVTMGAPRVVAKGVDHLALEIREVARQQGIPTVEDRPLARTLYRTVEVGGEVPPKLYQAVAEVLAFVYRLKRKAS